MHPHFLTEPKVKQPRKERTGGGGERRRKQKEERRREGGGAFVLLRGDYWRSGDEDEGTRAVDGDKIF